jgi:hypothetical protein
MGFSCRKFCCHRSERTEPVTSGLKARATLAWGKPGWNAPGHRHLTNCGPKARATLAWGNAPGHGHLTNCGQKARAKRLIPNKLFVEGNAILRKHRPHLFLKVTPHVMGSLRIDISHQCEAVSQPDGERRIATLPAELRKLRTLRLNPLGRRDLQSLDNSRNRFRPRKEKCDVNMIGNTPNTNADVFRSIENRGQVGMHLGLDCIIQKWTSVLGTKHQMHKNVRKGLGHDGEYNASFQPANLTSTLTWGLAPGYKISGLQPASLRTITNLANDMAASEARTVLWPSQTTVPIPPIQNTAPTLSGLKARATLAWGNAPGHRRPTICGLKARAKCLAGNFCTAVALLLLVSAIPSLSQTQSPPIHIKVINAQTNKPIHDERLNVALKTDQIGSVAMATDKNGIILVDYGKATIIRILSNMYADCRPRAELYTDYPIATILKTGITTGNLCSSASPKAKPGELILFEIPKTYIPVYPAPPLPPPPHSDENPHQPQTNH